MTLSRNRQNTLIPLSLVASLFVACAAEDATVAPASDELVRFQEGQATCVTLYAGQTIDAGTVCSSIDNTVDTSASCGAGSTGVMDVTFTTVGGWELVEAHLAAGDDFADIPTNKAGNPKIGNFPFNSGDISGATTHAFTVPLCEFGLDGSDEVCDPVTTYLAAHAAVRRDKGDGSYQTETGWGDGDRFVQKGSWAEYFNQDLECYSEEEPPPPPEPRSCETAFAFGGDDATCFIDADFDGDGADDGFNRWGWSNGPLGPGSYSYDIYQAAGRCDLSKGDLVGTLSIVYDGSSATVSFATEPGFVMDETHLYVGNEPLAIDNGEYTVAPGQYGNTHDLSDATADSYTVGGLSGDIYIVAHAVTCE